MDATSADNPPEGEVFSPNAFDSLCSQLFIKQETTDEAAPSHTRFIEYEELKTVKDEVKLEEPEYVSQNDIAYGSLCNQVSIKQETTDEETVAHMSVSEYDVLQTVKDEVKLELDLNIDHSSLSEYDEFKSVKDEVKFEESEYAGHDDVVQNISDFKNGQSSQISKKSTAAERNKKYREKKKLLGKTKEEKAKAAQRSKNYRERKKLLKKFPCDSDGLESANSKKKAKKPKTNAQFCREYRQRKKLIRQSQSSTCQSRRAVQIIIFAQVQPWQEPNTK